MTNRFFAVPYDSGHKDFRMGAGPARLAKELSITAEQIEPRGSFRAEIGTAFDLYRRLAEKIGETQDVPIVFSGNCGASVGTAAGVGIDDLAVIWFDAHGDFMTPATTSSGYLDGMSLSFLMGRCFQKLTAAIPGFKSLPGDRVLHAGGHDWDEGELVACRREGIAAVADADAAIAALDDLAKRASRILIHIDMDVIDTKYGAANHYAVPGGLSPGDIVRIINRCRERFRIAALGLASYDPSFDTSGAIAKAGAQFVKAAL